MKNTQFKRYRQIARYWLFSFGPLFFVVALGASIFRPVIIASVASTPHPELVYLILGVFLVGALSAMKVLAGFIQEENVLLRWQRYLSDGHALGVVNDGFIRKSKLMPIFNLLHSHEDVSMKVRHVMIENELMVIENGVGESLDLTNFIAGSLVGLGLVGTFIGLLGTLEDLGALFASLGEAGSSKADAGQLFGDMVHRLQEPMRGMSTAFIASLYGLMGSLVLGLVVISVKMTGAHILEELRAFVRAQGGQASEGNELPPIEQLEAETLEPYFKKLVGLHEDALVDSAQLRSVVNLLANKVEMIAGALQERTEIDMAIQKLIGSGVHWVDSWEQIKEQLQKLNKQVEMEHLANTQKGHDQYFISTKIHDSLKAIDEKIALANHNLGGENRELISELKIVATLFQNMQFSMAQCRDEFALCSDKLRSIMAINKDRGE